MNFFGKKQRQKIMDQRAQAIVLGNQVRTQSGFYGTIVDIAGDTVTLESPAGDETVWHKHAIALEEAPPYSAGVEIHNDDEVSGIEDDEPEYGERLEIDETSELDDDQENTK